MNLMIAIICKENPQWISNNNMRVMVIYVFYIIKNRITKESGTSQ